MSTASITNDHGDPPPISYPDGLPDRVAPLGDRAAGWFRNVLLVVGVSGLVLIIGAVANPRQFFHSYLFGYVFALDISLGALFWVLIHHVSDAGWSVGLRRVYENISRAIIPLAVLFIPVLIGIFSGNLHAWYGFVHGAEPTEENLNHLWHVKHVYFATPFFLARLALYFGVW